jgi:hypothetical protein
MKLCDQSHAPSDFLKEKMGPGVSLSAVRPGFAVRGSKGACFGMGLRIIKKEYGEVYERLAPDIEGSPLKLTSTARRHMKIPVLVLPSSL